ncbi:MAG: SDR family oxidoreductase [Myxococcota bacterium]
MEAKQVVVIAGSSRGIGRAAAMQASASGHAVVLFSRNGEALDALASSLGEDASWVAGDIGLPDDVGRLAAQVEARYGRVDQLFVSAGFAPFGPLDELHPAVVERALQTHIAGPLYLVKALLPWLREGGAILLTASGMHHRPLAEAALWVACTSAVVGLARSLAIELAPRKINVNALSHGPVDTPIFDDYGMPPEAVAAMKADLASQTLAKRMATTEEIAALALSLLRPGSYVNGTEIIANGGWNLAGR